MEFVTNYRLEEYILRLKWEDLSDEIRERTIMCSIDLFGSLILGSYGSQYKIGLNLARSLGLNGNIPVIGSHDGKFNILGATIAFSHASNSFDIDDGNRQICGHPGASFIGGVLAAALDKNIDYRQFLTTLTVCYECTIRWAIAMQDHYGYLHSTGAYGAFGTAVGIGRILGLTRKQLNAALSIADYHAPMTPVMRAVEFPSMNKDGVPFGSLIGCMSVLESLLGYTGRTHLLELAQYKNLLDDIGLRNYILDLYFKQYTCCRWTHQPIKACFDLKHENNIFPEQIQTVTIHTFTAAAKLSKIKPMDTDEAQYNIAFPIACSLVCEDVGIEEICDLNVQNKSILTMMDKLNFIVDPDLDQQFPDKRLAYVEIGLKDGRSFKSNIYEAEGEPDDPKLNLDWIQTKFRRITKHIIPDDKQTEILSLLSNCNQISIRTIISSISESLIQKTYSNWTYS